ncbi:hypothetical protein WA026_022614 [Henosepilachna vigintioctopunctata]|uniref:Uncharacterized protein n=1 Tax=Henosepilachna vigintioctopunctata TaxID=420089 RepID=A0AAW1V415_9CUCU
MIQIWRKVEVMEISKKVRFSTEEIGENGELNCSNCRNYLSIGPVLYNSIFGYICGRKPCAWLASSDGDNTNQVLYENVAKFLLFPCKFRGDGCVSELKWGEVEQHEEVCEYKNLKFSTPPLQHPKKNKWNRHTVDYHREHTSSVKNKHNLHEPLVSYTNVNLVDQ